MEGESGERVGGELECDIISRVFDAIMPVAVLQFCCEKSVRPEVISFSFLFLSS